MKADTSAANTYHKAGSQNVSEMELATPNRLMTGHEDPHRYHDPHDGHTYIDMETFIKAKAEFSISDNTSNPGPLGLFGFGLTTFLLNLHNAGVFPMNSTIFAMGICYGGIAQIIAGVFEWHKNKMFTSVVFISYGLFWWSLILALILAHLGVAAAPDNVGMGFYLFIWGAISFGFLICSMKRPKVIFLVFLTVVLLFWLLAIAQWTGDPKVLKAAGIDGIICSLLAIYAGLGELLNETFGTTILPMGMPKKVEKRF